MKIRSRLLTRLLTRLAIHSFSALFATCRRQHIASEPRLTLAYDHAAQGDEERFILPVWHDSLLMPTFLSKQSLRRQTCCLVSRHQDGGYLADVLELLGFRTVRGSTSKGGAAAVRQLLDDTRGFHIVITPDGPRGPRREMKAGPIYLASQTGRRIVPSRYICDRAWVFKGSWTDLVVPKPFSRIRAISGDPIFVPPDLDREGIAHYVEVVQSAMDRLHDDTVAIEQPVEPAKQARAA